MITINAIDVTSLVDIGSVTFNDTLDESLASGSMVIPLHTKNTPYERFSQVNIDGMLFVIAEDNVRLLRKGSNKLYRHEISLIEPTKILQKRVLPNLTVTQPQGAIADYVFTTNRVNPANFTDGGYLVDNTQTTIPLIQTSESKDETILINRFLKNTNEYEIYIDYTIENRQEDTTGQGQITPSPDAEIEFEVYYGATKIGETKVVYIEGQPLRPFNIFSPTNPIVHFGGFKLDYTPSVIDQAITIKAKTLGSFILLTDDELYITSLSLTITQSETVDDNLYLDDVVDKLLSFYPEFTLADATRAKIAKIQSPEFTFQNYTLYDALKEVANYATAIAYLGDQDFTTIHFYFYDQVYEQTFDFAEQQQVEYLDGLADGLELNAANVIRDENELYAIHEPDTKGWLSVRSSTDERGEQVIDSQASIELQHPIYRAIKVLVRGLAFTMKDESNQDVNFAATEEWDITEYVVEQQKYNTFTSQANLNSRGNFQNKSNSLYYRQGDDKIYGLGYIGTLPPAWFLQTPPNYAIWEAILNKAAKENPTYTFTTDYLVNLNNVSIHDLQFQVKHIPYSDVRLTVYKQNNRGKNIVYFNEQAPLNDMELLGRIAQENAQRTGNKTIRYEGLTYNNRFALGSKRGDEVLVNYTISKTPKINKFVAEYAVGYANISDYVGINSQYRQFEVPTDTIVNRRDKLTQFFDLSAAQQPPAVLVPEYLETDNNNLFLSMFGNFQTTPGGIRPTYAKVILDENDTVESTIDSFRMGHTLGLAINMYDNFSAGTKKVDQQIWDGTENLDIKVQEDSRYTDLLGRFTQAEIQFWDESGSEALTASNNYPDNNTSPTNQYLDYTYTVNKDARERWGFIWEIVFSGSTDGLNDVKIYDGFVKYNRLATELTPTPVEIRFLPKGYFPDRNVDITRTTRGTGTIQVETDKRYLTIQATAPEGEYEGLVITLNEEAIFAIRSDEYDFGTQVTKYLYPRAFTENDYSLRIEQQITFEIAAAGFIYYLQNGAASATISSSFNAAGNAQETALGDIDTTIATQFSGVGNIYIQENDVITTTIQTAFNAVGGKQETETDGLNETITTVFNAVGNIYIDEQGSTAETITSSFNAVGSIFINEDGTASTSVTAVFNAIGNAFIDQDGSLTDTINGQLTATGQIATLYNLRGYATATPVNIVVDFDDSPATSFTLQTFTQTIGTKPNGTNVTVTAPSSYTLNGATYTFVDWRVDETSQTSTNREFTTTIDQQKTLRLRYIAFGFI